MEFSTIGAEDSLEEAKNRLESVEILVVWGNENIIGVLTKDHLGRTGNCGSACELDILIDPDSEKSLMWMPLYIISTDDGEPVNVSRAP